jgi:hypothetical protein
MLTSDNPRDLPAVQQLEAELRLLLDRDYPHISPRITGQELYNYLKVKDWNIHTALSSIVACARWREMNGIDYIIDDHMIPDLTQYNTPVGLDHKWDRQGNAIFFSQAGKVDVSQFLRTYDNEVIIRFVVKKIETGLNRLSRDPETAKITVLVDLEGFGIKHLPWMSRAVDLMRRLAFVFENYYPRRLSRMFVVNTPSMFASLWSQLKQSLRLRGEDLIEVMDSNYLGRLVQFIERENLPIALGGTCNCSFCAPAQPNWGSFHPYPLPIKQYMHYPVGPQVPQVMVPPLVHVDPIPQQQAQLPVPQVLPQSLPPWMQASLHQQYPYYQQP